MSFKDSLKGVRYRQGESWADRSVKAVEDLADLKAHRGYAFLLDTWNGNIRCFFKGYMDKNVSDEDVLKDRHRAMWIFEQIAELEEMTSEKDLQSLQAECYEGFTADAEIAAAHAQHAETGNY